MKCRNLHTTPDLSFRFDLLLRSLISPRPKLHISESYFKGKNNSFINRLRITLSKLNVCISGDHTLIMMNWVA